MSERLTLTIDGEQVQVDAGTTGLQYFTNDKDVVVMHVDGVLRDLARELVAGTTVTRVTITDPEGLEVFRVTPLPTSWLKLCGSCAPMPSWALDRTSLTVSTSTSMSLSHSPQKI